MRIWGHRYSDHRGIELRNAVNGNDIRYNYVHETHDGIETKSNQRDPDLMQNTNVHHNFIVDVLDDSLEPNAGGVNCRWHHNWLQKQGTGMRIKFPVAGPLYVYRNVFDGANAWSFRDSKATVCFYHNTMHTRRRRAAPRAVPRRYHISDRSARWSVCRFASRSWIHLSRGSAVG